MRSTITYGGNVSSSYGLVIERYPTLDRPSRKYEKASVAGRNGDLFFLQDAFENYDQEYEVFAGSSNAPSAWIDVMDFLYPSESSLTVDDYINLTVNGYKRLIDSYEPNTIRLAVLTDSIGVENISNRHGKAKIKFSCRPERFTSAAFTAVNIASTGSTITNPTNRYSKPCIKVYGTGSGAVVVNGYVCTISTMTTYLYIDSDLQNCYRGVSDSNQNSAVTLTSGFPILKPGSNTITFSGDVTSVDIYPRWWNL